MRIEAASLNNFPSFRIDYADNLSRADACDVKPAERAATPEETVVDPHALTVFQWENIPSGNTKARNYIAPDATIHGRGRLSPQILHITANTGKVLAESEIKAARRPYRIVSAVPVEIISEDRGQIAAFCPTDRISQDVIARTLVNNALARTSIAWFDEPIGVVCEIFWGVGPCDLDAVGNEESVFVDDVITIENVHFIGLQSVAKAKLHAFRKWETEAYPRTNRIAGEAGIIFIVLASSVGVNTAGKIAIKQSWLSEPEIQNLLTARSGHASNNRLTAPPQIAL